MINPFLLIYILLSLLFPSFIFAQELQYPPIPGITTPQPGISLEEFARYLYHFFLIAGAIIAFVIFIYSGFLYLISVGNPPKVKEAKDRITSALFGLLILFGSYIILTTLDPHLVIFQPTRLSTLPSLPPAQKVEAPPPIPKHCLQVTTLEKDSKDLIGFLNDKILAWNTFIGKTDVSSLFADLQDAQKIDCSQAFTLCSPKCLDSIPIKCQWKNSDLKQSIQNEIQNSANLAQLKQIIRELIESEEANRLKGTLNKLASCQMDLATILFINGQAEEKGILNNLGITNKDPLYFYCCSY